MRFLSRRSGIGAFLERVRIVVVRVGERMAPRCAMNRRDDRETERGIVTTWVIC